MVLSQPKIAKQQKKDFPVRSGGRLAKKITIGAKVKIVMRNHIRLGLALPTVQHEV